MTEQVSEAFKQFKNLWLVDNSIGTDAGSVRSLYCSPAACVRLNLTKACYRAPHGECHNGVYERPDPRRTPQGFHRLEERRPSFCLYQGSEVMTSEIRKY